MRVGEIPVLAPLECSLSLCSPRRPSALTRAFLSSGRALPAASSFLLSWAGGGSTDTFNPGSPGYIVKFPFHVKTNKNEISAVIIQFQETNIYMDNEIHSKKKFRPKFTPTPQHLKNRVQDHSCLGNVHLILSIFYLVKDTCTKPQSQNRLVKSTRIQFLQNFYTDIINVGGTVKMPRFRSLREEGNTFMEMREKAMNLALNLLIQR